VSWLYLVVSCYEHTEANPYTTCTELYGNKSIDVDGPSALYLPAVPVLYYS